MLKDNLIGVWCEGASPLTDLHTNGLTMTDNNTVTTVAGKVGTAGDFERNLTEFLSRADEALLSTGNIDFTVAAWVQVETTGTRHIGSKGQEYAFKIEGLDAACRFIFGIANGVVEVTANTFGAPALLTWYYAQAQHDAVNNLLRIRVNNGAWNQITTGATVPVDAAVDFQIGALGGIANWDGLINQFAFWKAKKSDADLNEIYNAGSGLAFSAWDLSAGPGPGSRFGTLALVGHGR